MTGVPVRSSPCTLVIHVTLLGVREVALTGGTHEVHGLPRGAARASLRLAAHHEVSLPVIASNLHQDLQSVHLAHLLHLLGIHLLSCLSVGSWSADVFEDVERFVVCL